MPEHLHLVDRIVRGTRWLNDQPVARVCRVAFGSLRCFTERRIQRNAELNYAEQGAWGAAARDQNTLAAIVQRLDCDIWAQQNQAAYTQSARAIANAIQRTWQSAAKRRNANKTRGIHVT